MEQPREPRKKPTRAEPRAGSSGGGAGKTGRPRGKARGSQAGTPGRWCQWPFCKFGSNGKGHKSRRVGGAPSHSCFRKKPVNSQPNGRRYVQVAFLKGFDMEEVRGAHTFQQNQQTKCKGLNRHLPKKTAMARAHGDHRAASLTVRDVPGKTTLRCHLAPGMASATKQRENRPPMTRGKGALPLPPGAVP